MGWGCNCIPSHCNLAPCHPQPKARGGGGNARAQAPSPPSPRRHLPLGSGSGNGGGGWQRGAPMATHRQGGGPDHWPRCHPTPWGHWGGLGGCIPTPSEFNVFASYRVTVVTRCTTEHVLRELATLQCHVGPVLGVSKMRMSGLFRERRERAATSVSSTPLGW